MNSVARLVSVMDILPYASLLRVIQEVIFVISRWQDKNEIIVYFDFFLFAIVHKYNIVF